VSVDLPQVLDKESVEENLEEAADHFGVKSPELGRDNFEEVLEHIIGLGGLASYVNDNSRLRVNCEVLYLPFSLI
jgi:hypothetical protein